MTVLRNLFRDFTDLDLLDPFVICLYVVDVLSKHFNGLSTEDKWETHGGFFRALGTTPGPITTAEEAGDDEGFEKQQQEAIKLYR